MAKKSQASSSASSWATDTAVDLLNAFKLLSANETNKKLQKLKELEELFQSSN
jgi:hypothetical protein